MKKKIFNSRKAIQIFFFLLVAGIVYNHNAAEMGLPGLPFFSDSNLHGICPFGGVVTLYSLVTEGTLVQKVHLASVVLLVSVVVSAVFFGPLFCGWVCPLGSFQEWIGVLGRKVSGKRFNVFIPAKADRIMRFFRYLVLGAVVYRTAVSGVLMFADIDPYYALFNFWTGETAVGALAILAAVTVFSLFVERPWCKYCCPLGAFLGISNFFSVFKIRRNSDTCVSCGCCDRICPMNIRVSEKKNVSDHQCIRCLKCTSENSCPVQDTVNLSPFFAGSVKIRNLTAAILVLAFIFGGYATGKAAGYWTTEKDRRPGGGKTTAVAADPAEIRGSTTFGEIEILFDVPVEVLTEAFGVSAESVPEDFRAGSVEEIYGESGFDIGTGSVRYFTALYSGLPYEPDEEVWFPAQAYVLLEARNVGDDSGLEYVRTHLIEDEK